MVSRRQIRKELNHVAELVEAASERRERRADDEFDEGLICTGIGSIAVCTNTAVYLASRLGGAVYGYSIEDNPQAQVGKDEFGHDFTVVDDRWLVDFWARDTYQLRDIYDLHNPKDLKLVRRLYGPRENWQKMSREDFEKNMEINSSIMERS